MTSTPLAALGARLLVDDDGQDIVEYALLSALVAIAGVLVVPIITTKMANAFVGWGTQVQALSVPDPPQ